MVDIVDRLRDPSLGSPRWMETMTEAANEIEWLRKVNARLTVELGKAHKDIIPWIEKASRLEAELDAAQDALRKANG